MKFFSALCVVLIMLFFNAGTAQANNVQISGVSVSGSNITFNLSWENSWNSTNNIDTLYPNNWDAIWVFVKVQSSTTNLWSHQNISTVAANHTASGTTPLTFEPGADSVGVFIRRTNAGSGNIASTAVTLKMGGLPTGTLNFKVFGIEMVRIPQGAYHLGDGNTSGSTFTTRFTATTISNAGIAGGTLYAGSPAIPFTYPKGFEGLYAMRYEATNEQVAEFYNTLTYDQQAGLWTANPNDVAGTQIYNTQVGFTNTGYLRIQTPGISNTTPATVGVDYNNDGLFNDNADGLTIAHGGMLRRGMVAYMDWSGLRPMTEMEFEKIARGSRITGNPVERVLNEHAWGSTTLVTYNTTSTAVVNDFQPDMRVNAQVTDGRATLGFGSGPMRPGIYADTATGRMAAGAGYYGNMDLTGNVGELCVAVNAGGVTYTGLNGDGIISVTADANQANWPSPVSNSFGWRGGHFSGVTNTANTPFYYIEIGRTSSRNYAASADPGRDFTIGFRAVR